jgi:hypothetical protein
MVKELSSIISQSGISYLPSTSINNAADMVFR